MGEEALIKKYFSMVASIAEKFAENNMCSLDDYIQVGCIALLKAIRSFDPNRGTKVGTYAWLAIKWAILAEAKRHSNLKRNGTVKLLRLAEVPDEEFEIIALKNMCRSPALFDIIPGGLTDDEEMILMLRSHNMSFKEIRRKLGRSREWVHSTMISAVQKIREANAT